MGRDLWGHFPKAPPRPLKAYKKGLVWRKRGALLPCSIVFGGACVAFYVMFFCGNDGKFCEGLDLWGAKWYNTRDEKVRRHGRVRLADARFGKIS